MATLTKDCGTVKAKKARKKPERHVRWFVQPENGIGVVRITIKTGKKVEIFDYSARLLETDFGVGVHLVKLNPADGSEYAVNLDPQEEKHTCECKGFLRWGKPCKHIDGLNALRSSGRWF